MHSILLLLLQYGQRHVSAIFYFITFIAVWSATCFGHILFYYFYCNMASDMFRPYSILLLLLQYGQRHVSAIFYFITFIAIWSATRFGHILFYYFYCNMVSDMFRLYSSLLLLLQYGQRHVLALFYFITQWWILTRNCFFNTVHWFRHIFITNVRLFSN